jgi:hypothetical protein
MIDSPVDSFPSHRPQELVGRCRLATSVAKIINMLHLTHFLLASFSSLDSPAESFPPHRPQELVGRCRLATTVTKILLLAWIEPSGQIRYKVKLLINEFANQFTKAGLVSKVISAFTF